MATMNEERQEHKGGSAFFLIAILTAFSVYSEADKRSLEKTLVQKIARQDSVIVLRDSTINVMFPKAVAYDSEQVRVQKAKDHIKELVADKINRQK